MAPKASEKMTVALRVLDAIAAGSAPDREDARKLRMWAPTEEFHYPLDHLARATVARETAKEKKA